METTHLNLSIKLYRKDWWPEEIDVAKFIKISAYTLEWDLKEDYTFS